ncbi:3-deoxy-D-manno-octulosonate cytidylyltransferase [Nautilia profundicola AmH]|uniref:3-deoxy-D-manno-octulosonate cytidylyltransferase n=1 Tax=Nautilia profundicola (strain ATCC BAA-1463 / DSM 18972 / AmH) TaxID=598659 RepID=B9L5H8_NAUPA|nr:3-deoxy-manno-octulosonate cytidylyltransferase [Nautilia profundicola]ACM93278.1 3-deoxy-D-manno-octulosonate cytidylyltransferase [Nautilia profundicola AmH]
MIIIPARLSSSRLPNKVLAEINNKPMIIWCAEVAKKVDDVCIATDSQKVIDICKQYGFNAVMTSDKHQSGSDRIKEAADILKLKDDEIVINMQGDEPFLEPEILTAVKEKLFEIKNRDFVMVSCYKEIDELHASDPNLVKVIMDKNEDAIYFSRSKIPYNRDNVPHQYFGHIGIYGFDKKSLDEFITMKGTIEHIEKLEQLRVIENGKKIAMLKVKTKSFGIDTKDDLEKARTYAKSSS